MQRRTFMTALAASAAGRLPRPAQPPPETADCLQPALALPRPSGRYPIGTVSMHLLDPSRTDPWVPAHPIRELMIQLWYPATHTAPYPHARYIAPQAARHLAAAASARLGVNVPAPAFSTLDTAAHLLAPIAKPPQRGWPVILFSPGDGLDRSSCTTLLQDLASHGYITVGIDHTHDSGEVQFPDGRLEVRTLPPGSQDAATLVRAADTRFVINQLEHLATRTNPHTQDRALPAGIARALDLTRLGMFGHSHGGTSTAESMLQDPRIRAGVDIDGPVSDRVAAAGLHQGFLNLDSQIGGAARAKFEHNLLLLWPRLTGWNLWLRLQDSGHLNFTDFSVFAAQLRAPQTATAGLLGTIEPRRALAITALYLRAYFAQELDHQPQSLLEHPSPAVPEMIFETAPRPTTARTRP